MKPMAGAVVIAAAALFPLAAYAQDAKAAKGKELFTAQKCTLCHAIAGAGNKKGPLDDVGAKLTPDQIKAWITDPEGTAAKTTPAPTRKPPMKKKPLSPGDVEALVAYLSGLK
jgi:mono/diheme cytochrome c family protein